MVCARKASERLARARSQVQVGTEAPTWIARKSKAWLKKGATRTISRVSLPQLIFLRQRAFSTFFRLGPARFMAPLTSPLLLSVSLRIEPRNPVPQPLVSCLGFDRASFVPCCHLLPDQSSTAARFTAGAFGFLLLIQCRERPELYGESRRLDMMPSSPSLQAWWKTSGPSSSTRCSLNRRPGATRPSNRARAAFRS